MKKASLVLALVFLTVACTSRPTTSAIGVENLINSSAEKISFPITDDSSLAAIADWISENEAPSSAEFYCGSSSNACSLVKKLLSKNKVSVTEIPGDSSSPSGGVALIYNRLVARDCKAVSFGCSTSANAIQMVSNRQQFVKPAMSDLQDSATAVKAINKLSK